MKKYKYSIIIPHINEWYLLDITLDSIYSKIKYDNFEIIIVDDWSNNLMDLAFVKKHKLKEKIKVFYKNNLWLANAKNFWAKNSTWDILIFLDSHMYFTDDALEKINKIFNKFKEIDLLQPIIWSIQDKLMEGSIYKIKDNLFYSSWDLPKKDWKDINFNQINGIIETPNIAGGATIVKKQVYKKLSWFNKHFIKWWCEDLDFSTRAWLSWYKCFFTPKVFIAHYFKQNFTNTTVKTEEVLNNRLMFLYTCFSNKNRIEKAIIDLSEHYWKELFNSINYLVNHNLRFIHWLENQKKHFIYDDDWYFNKFKEYYLDFIKTINEKV